MLKLNNIRDIVKVLRDEGPVVITFACTAYCPDWHHDKVSLYKVDLPSHNGAIERWFLINQLPTVVLFADEDAEFARLEGSKCDYRSIKEKIDEYV